MEVSELPVENGPLPDGPTLGERLEALQLRMRKVRITGVLNCSLASLSHCLPGLNWDVLALAPSSLCEDAFGAPEYSKD